MSDKIILKDDCYVHHNCKKYLNNDCNKEFCIRLFKLNELFNKSLLTDAQRGNIKLRLDSNRIDEPAYKVLKRYQDNIIDFVNNGTNLYIYSTTTGNGKTSWAIKLLQAYLYKIWPSSPLKCRTLFINVPKYMRELKLNISHFDENIDYVNTNIVDADLVIWDDIATKTASEYEMEQLISIIDSRINDNKSNIFTSNIPPDILNQFIGGRLYSRIVGLCKFVNFKGSDKRGASV